MRCGFSVSWLLVLLMAGQVARLAAVRAGLADMR
jgi:hypothetical protein